VHPLINRFSGRLRVGWTAAHAPVAGVAGWTRTAAYLVPLTVLPSSLWRIAVCTFHLPIGPEGRDWADTSSGIPGLPLAAYVVVLSVVAEALAFTAVGLIASWGEVFPRRIPLVGGRAVPTLVAVVPAGVGATVLTVLWTWTAVSFCLGRRIDGSLARGPRVLELDDWQGWLAVLAYAPLILWGPLLAAVTIGYWKRRRGPRTAHQRGDNVTTEISEVDEVQP
jgi:hypothetical protein